MSREELFVGAVAIALGVLAVTCGALNWSWCYRLRVLRMIHQRWGATAARVACGLIGLALVALGVSIVW